MNPAARRESARGHRLLPLPCAPREPAVCSRTKFDAAGDNASLPPPRRRSGSDALGGSIARPRYYRTADALRAFDQHMVRRRPAAHGHDVSNGSARGPERVPCRRLPATGCQCRRWTRRASRPTRAVRAYTSLQHGIRRTSSARTTRAHLRAAGGPPWLWRCRDDVIEKPAPMAYCGPHGA